MNTHPLNSTVLGAGQDNNRIYAGATQALRLTGQLAVDVWRRANINQTLTLSGAVLAVKRTGVSASQAFKLSGELAAQTYHIIRASISGRLSLGTAIQGINRTPQLGEIPLGLRGHVDARVIVRVPVSATQTLRLAAALTPNERVTRTDAPFDRTTGLVDITNRETQTVIFGG